MIELGVDAEWCSEVQSYLRNLDAPRFANRIEIERVNYEMYDPYLVKFTTSEFRSISTVLLIARTVFEENNAYAAVAEIESLVMEVEEQLADHKICLNVSAVQSPTGSQIFLLDALTGDQSVELIE
jgi:hypothetical protein